MGRVAWQMIFNYGDKYDYLWFFVSLSFRELCVISFIILNFNSETKRVAVINSYIVGK